MDVFIYPGPDFDVRCASECAAEDTLVPDSTDAWRMGRAMEMRVVRHGNVSRSDLVLWYVPTYRVKLRATYPNREPIRAYVRFFTDSIVGAIVRWAISPARLLD